MKKKAARILSVLVILVTVASAFCLSVSADYTYDGYTFPGTGKISQNAYYYDESHLFSDEEVGKINDLVQNTADRTGFNVGVFTAGRSRSDNSVEEVAIAGCKGIFPNNRIKGSVFFYIDLDGYTEAYDYIYADYDAVLYYTGSSFGNRCRTITKACQKSFPPGGGKIEFDDIYEGLQTFSRYLIDYKTETGMEKGAYYYDSQEKMFHIATSPRDVTVSFLKPYDNWKFVLFFGLALSIVVCLFVSAGTVKKYKFKETPGASVYTSKNHIHIRTQTDTLVSTNVYKTRVSSSSSGGGGGHGGGGHSSGGGGGSHR